MRPFLSALLPHRSRIKSTKVHLRPSNTDMRDCPCSVAFGVQLCRRWREGAVNGSRIKGVSSKSRRENRHGPNGLSECFCRPVAAVHQRPFLQSGGKIPLSNVDKLES